MKKAVKLFGIIALMAVIGFTMAACKDEPNNENTDIFTGTWTTQMEGSDMKLVAANGSFTVDMDGHSAFRGTYTVSGNTVSITFTSVNTGYMSGGADEWTSYDDIPEGTDGMPPKTFDAVITGNSFSFESITFTKQS